MTPPVRTATQRAQAAMEAMEAFGFKKSVAKQALKMLLKENENNWDYVETSNYSVLAQCIFDLLEDTNPPPPPQVTPATRSKTKRGNDQASPSVKKPKTEVEAPAAIVAVDSGESDEVPLQRYRRTKRTPTPTQSPEVKVEPGAEARGKGAVEVERYRKASPLFEVPLAVIHPTGKGEKYGDGSLVTNADSRVMDVPQTTEEQKASNGTAQELAKVDQAVGNADIEVASSGSGELPGDFGANKKDGVMVNEFGGPEVVNTENASPEDASLEDANEDREVVNLDGENSNTANLEAEYTNVANLVAENIITGNLDAENINAANLAAENINIANLDAEKINAANVVADNINIANLDAEKINAADPVAENINTANLVAENFNNANFDSANSLAVVHPPQLALVPVRPSHDVSDITRGKERSKIPVVNELNDGRLPAPFYYIKKNNLYQNAKVNFSFARIGDEDCCTDCFGDCLAAPVPCFCKEKNDGGFAYTKDGLIKTEFLDQSMSMKQNPENHKRFFCERCPLERIKDGVAPGPCKGHLIRKFVKECWNKCGCSKKCGNRVVQRGIAHNLQVFFTGEAKGWGVQTLDPLPRGSFVCEYVGEIVTRVELYDRTLKTMSNARDTHQVLLDAGWESKGTLEDGEVLSLDATIHGNVARFVNHQCHDANLIEIPVEVETPDRHYYRLALFTTRKVEAFEELTWDYGINFDDNNQPLKTFQCRCESRYCRDVNHTMDESALVK